MGENATWDKRLLVRCSYHEAERARKYAYPEERFTVLGTFFLIASELSLKFYL